MDRKIKNKRLLLLGAYGISLLFSPHIFPILSFLLMFRFTFLSLLPLLFAIYVMAVVFLTTIAMPAMAMVLYRRTSLYTKLQSKTRHVRMIPYIIYILCYLVCREFLTNLSMPQWVYGVIVVSLATQIMCAVLNLRWKMSMHSAASGAVCGALLAFSIIFHFNPVWWLCLTILINGIVCTARVVLRIHTVEQVLASAVLGCICGLLCILFA